MCYYGTRKEFVSLFYWWCFFFLSLLGNAFTSSSLESSYVSCLELQGTIWAVCHQKSWFLPASSHYSVRRTLTLFLSLLIRLFLFWAFKEEARAFLPLPRSSCEEGCLSVPLSLLSQIYRHEGISPHYPFCSSWEQQSWLCLPKPNGTVVGNGSLACLTLILYHREIFALGLLLAFV